MEQHAPRSSTAELHEILSHHVSYLEAGPESRFRKCSWHAFRQDVRGEGGEGVGWKCERVWEAGTRAACMDPVAWFRVQESLECLAVHLSMPAKGAMCRRCSAWWCKDELATLGCRRCIERSRVKWTLQKVLPKCVGAIVFEHLWLANEFSLAKARRPGYCVHDHRCRCGHCRGMPGSESGRRRIVHRWCVLSLRTRTGK